MGTRGAFGVQIDGVEKIGYNQYDSYPDGHGVENLAFVREIVEQGKVDLFKQIARDCKVVDENEKPTTEDILNLSEQTNLQVSEQSTDDWYCLTRETHGDIKAMLECGYILDSKNFPQDSLFCEWAYMVDFDNEVFEVYKGFQKVPHTEGRFADRTEGREGGYYPVRLIASYKFSELPSDEDFIQELYPSCATCGYKNCDSCVDEPAVV